MKTEDLKNLGLDDNQVSEVFKMHGLEIAKYKNFESENEVLKTEKLNLETQLTTANTKISEFEKIDVDSIKKEVDDYKTKYEEANTKYEEDIKNLKVNNTIENALLKAKVKNAKAAKVLLDLETLKTSQNFDSDLEVQINSLKENESYLFESDTQFISGGNQVPPDKGKMTYSEMMDYITKNPGAKI